MKKSYEELGGREKLIAISKNFYDKVYADPWLGKFFVNVPQDIIEVQQVDFLQSSLGGDQVYCGKLPVAAHMHMLITDELYDLRSELLMDALKECGACAELIDRIAKIDSAFRPGIIKNSVDKCEKRFFTDELLVFPKPIDYKKVG